MVAILRTRELVPFDFQSQVICSGQAVCVDKKRLTDADLKIAKAGILLLIRQIRLSDGVDKGPHRLGVPDIKDNLTSPDTTYMIIGHWKKQDTFRNGAEIFCDFA